MTTITPAAETTPDIASDQWVRDVLVPRARGLANDPGGA
jgi:hypothetical protein